ncbi:hypothetical protein OH77DRAFT_1430692 [Trametes cingulata]|nr:hypothetical protein OH77DRAFT_1430692 [Trametes cingulata]
MRRAFIVGWRMLDSLLTDWRLARAVAIVVLFFERLAPMCRRIVRPVRFACLLHSFFAGSSRTEPSPFCVREATLLVLRMPFRVMRCGFAIEVVGLPLYALFGRWNPGSLHWTV